MVSKNITPHYLVTIEGTYIKKDGNDKKAIAPYKETIPVPIMVTSTVWSRVFDPVTNQYADVEEEKTLHIDDFGVLSIILKTRKLDERLRKKDPMFHRIRTHEITDVKGSNPSIQMPSNPYLLNLPALRQFIETNHIPVNLKLFTTLSQLREALINYKEDPAAYKEFERRFKQRNSISASVSAAIDELEAEIGLPSLPL